MEANLINQVLNLVAPPSAILLIWLTLTSFKPLKRFLSLLNFFLLKQQLPGKVILITGASSGIGEELAYQYAKKGACLVLAARRGDRLRQVSETCLHLGSPDAIFIPTDISDVHQCKRAVQAAVSHFGTLDHLVNNAGVASATLLEECDDVTNLTAVMDINFWGSVYMSRFAIPHLRKSKGKITVVSSAASWLPLPRMAFYNATKSALVAFFETLRMEVWPEVGITIVCPGYIQSEMTQGKHLSRDGYLKFDPQLRDAQVGLVPVGRASDCAKAAIEGGRQGRRMVMEPDWIKVTRLWKIVCPEVVDMGLWLGYVTKASKKLLEIPGAKAVLHIPSPPTYQLDSFSTRT